ncbi:MAG TPA: UDP-2,3-diacylglucosamine diphosphatase LpxI [Planktothrix sp.]|jgi:hypothetical protein
MSASAVSTDNKSAATGQILGLVAGDGKLPAILAQSAAAHGYKVIALALSEDAFDLVSPHCHKVHLVAPGQLGRNIKLAHSEGIKEAVFIGRIPKINLLHSITKFDWMAIKEVTRLPNLNDDTIQQAFGGIMEQHGIAIRPQAEFLRHLFHSVGVLSKRQPNAAEYADIEFGLQVARETARLDIGQTVVVRDRIIIAVEAFEGTDRAIRRGVELARKPVTVVKVAKEGQDPRFDTPTVGVSTIEAMLAPKPGGVLAIGAGQVMLVDQEAVLKFADQHDIAVVAVQ